MTTLTTRSHEFDLQNPRPRDVSLYDVAWALEHVQRFGGHLPQPWSVLRHSLLVCEILRLKGEPRNVLLAGLLHDAPEAYTGDICRPLCAVVRNGASLTVALAPYLHPISEAVYEAFGITSVDVSSVAVRTADHDALQAEAVRFGMPWAARGSVPEEHLRAIDELLDMTPQAVRRMFTDGFHRMSHDLHPEPIVVVVRDEWFENSASRPE